MDPLPLDPAEDPGKRRRVWCRDCRRPLSSPESRLAGRGPDCQARHDPPSQTRTEQPHVDQDTLPGV